MKTLAAYLLIQAGGKAEPTVEDLKKVFASVGIEADDERISQVIAELGGKQIPDLISEGSQKLASVPTGGAAAPAAATGGASGAAPEEAGKEAEKEEESDSDIGMGLFD